MRFSPPSADHRAQAGFTLVELMVGIVIGLLASLAVTQVLVGAEGQKRTTSAASDAQINGALALDTVQRAVMPAGYGFTSMPALIGCTLTARFNGAAVPGFANQLVPVTILDGADGGPDGVRVLASGKNSFSVPLRVVGDGYDPNKIALSQSFQVAAAVGVQGPTANAPGDLLVAAVDTSVPCEVFQATATPGGPFVPRADDQDGWNAAKFPERAWPDGSYLVNLGTPVDAVYGITDGSLRVRALHLQSDGTPSYDAAPVELYPGIVQLQALYGKDTSAPADGTVDVWDAITPVDNAGWRQVIALRVALLARSTQFEKEDVTAEQPVWNLGKAVAVTGADDCDGAKCLTIKIDHLPDWKRYRYRLFETIVPLRNMVWSS